MSTRTSPLWWLVFLLLVLALVATGCRGAGGPGAPGATGDRVAGEVVSDVGVTDAPCPEAVNQDNGCIYLGVISDLTTGPFVPAAVPITDAQKVFWKRVNEQGGIGGFDIDVTRNTRDNRYNPQVHNQVYQEIKGDVLALAQTLGSATTAAIISDLRSNRIVTVPASWTSAWLYEPEIIESGASYCIESMNAVDYAVSERDVKSVMAVHFDGDYGDDGAAGVKIAAQANGIQFMNVEQTPKSLGGTTRAAVDAIVRQEPDLVILTVSPTETAEIVGAAAIRGYTGLFIGASQTWNPELLQTPAADAIKKRYLQSSPWGSFESNTPGHLAMREALEQAKLKSFAPNDGYTNGWVWSYPLKAALEKATSNGDLTRAGLLKAVEQLDRVDYEGMLPEGAGNFAGDPNDEAFRQNLINRPDDSSPTGLALVKDFFTGPTAKDYEFKEPCFQAQSV